MSEKAVRFEGGSLLEAYVAGVVRNPASPETPATVAPAPVIRLSSGPSPQRHWPTHVAYERVPDRVLPGTIPLTDRENGLESLMS
jgi:hypothetical protein